MIQVIKTLEELEALKNNWENLFTLASTATPYQAWHFVMTTWQVWHKSDDKLYIICYNQSKGKVRRRNERVSGTVNVRSI